MKPEIRATYRGAKVKVLDAFAMMQGENLAVVEALQGKPFIQGDKWPIRSNRAVVEVKELNLSLVFEAHDFSWIIMKGKDSYDLTRWHGVLPFFVGSVSSHLPIERALRELAARATKRMGTDKAYFEFLYSWMVTK